MKTLLRPGPGRAKRGLGLIVGTAIVVLGSSLTARTNAEGTKKDGPRPAITEMSGRAEAPPMAACADQEEAGKLYEMLRERLAEVKERELLVDRREKDMDERKKNLAVLSEELRTLRTQIDRRISDWSKEEDDDRRKRLNHLVNMVSSMPPARSSELLLATEEDLAVDVIGALDPQQAAQIMALLPPDRAAKFAKALTARRPL